jgi:hypothetical protein
LRARTDVTSLKLANEVKNTLDLTIDQVEFKRDTVKHRTERLEKKLEEVFKTILDNMQRENIHAEEKIEKIALAMEDYRNNITKLTKILAPGTPLDDTKRIHRILRTTHNS